MTFDELKGVEELVERMRQAPDRLWMADLVGQKISVERMRDILAFALAQQPAAVDCRCIDCGGNQPGHDPTCSYMRELHGEQPAAEIEALRAEVERLQRQLRQAHKDYGCELRDPNGTIWEYAAMQRDRAERLAEALRHQRWCRTCGEDGWDSCEEGRAAIDLLQAAYKEETND